MLGKNNFKERLRKMSLESKKDRFSIRKLTIGVASVLLGFTFMGVKGQTVKADTVQPEQNQSASATPTAELDSKSEAKSDASANKSSQNLTTYAGLKSFLRDDSSEAKPEEPAKTPDKDDQTPPTTDEQKPVTTPDENQTPIAPDQNTDQPATKPDENGQKPDSDTAVNITTGAEDNAAAATTTQKQKPQAKGLLETLNLATTTESSVNVGSWVGLLAAFNNSNIHEINIISNIQAPTAGVSDITVATRPLVIKSAVADPDNPGDSPRYTIDFQLYRPRDFNITPNVNITYENLNIYSRTFYGLMQTSSNTRAIVNFKNVNFIGSQMMYVGAHTEVHFYGTNTAQTVKSYTNDWGTYNAEASNQQLFEFTRKGGRLIFENGTQFTGTTYSGNVIEMTNGTTGSDTINGEQLANDNEVIVKSGADVTLNPKGGNMPDSANSVENSDSANGILIYSGQGSVDIQQGGNININVGGTTDYTGTINNRKAKAINLADSGSSLTVEDGGNLNIVTNGNISDKKKKGPASTLVNIGGNLIVGKKANFNITGTNMGNFAGTLMNIGGTSEITGSDFRIKLTDNPGTGKLTLLNPGNGTTITNPDDFLLDRGTNTAANIISTGNFTLNSVRLKQPGETVSNAFRTFGFKGNTDGTLTTLDTAIEGISPSDESAAIALINNQDLPTLEFISANDGFLAIDPITDDDIEIDNDDNEIITGYANEGGAYIAAVMPNSDRLGEITSPYHKEADQGIKYAAVSADTPETSGAHQGKFKFTITVPKASLTGITTGSMVTLTATKNFVEGDPSLEDPQNPQTAKLYAVDEIAAKRQADAAKAINDAADAAKQQINTLFGEDTAKAQPYLDAIDEWVNKSTANDPTSADSVYGTTDKDEIINRRDTAITAINQQVTDAETANAKAAREAAKQEVKEYAQKANQYLGTTDDEKIQAAVTAANKAIDEATGDGIDTAVVTAKKNILAAFKAQAQAAITEETTTNSNKIKNVFALSSTQKTKYDDELQSATTDGTSAIDATTDLDTAGQAFQDAKTNTEKVFDTAKTISELRTYKNTLKQKYPSLADELESESATYEEQIDAGTSDLATGKAALDKIVTTHNATATTELQTAYDKAKQELASSSNSKVQDALTAAQDAINAVGTAGDEADMTAKKEAAQTAIDKLNALISLQNEAASEKSKYAAMYPNDASVVEQINSDIDTALEAAIDKITNSSTTKDNLQEVTTAGIVGIDRVGAKTQLEQKAQEIKDQINNLSGLSAGERDEQIQKVEDLLTNSKDTGYQDQIDHAASQDAVNTLTTAGLTALNNLLTDQTLASEKNNAIIKLQDAQKAANDQIDGTSLSDADKAKYKQDIQDQVDQGISNIQAGTSQGAINDAEVTAENHINDIVTNANTQDTTLQAAQTAAINDLNQYAQTAKNMIDSLPAEQLSASEKETYKNQIDQAVTAATNNINTATTLEDVTSSKTIGKTNIDKVQVVADLAAAKAKAVQELTASQTANKQKIDELFTAGKIDAAKQAELKGKIDDFYNDAVDKVNHDTSTDRITVDKDAGIKAMNGVATDAANTANQEVADAKDTALDNDGNPIGLNNLAEQLKEHIEQDSNLGPSQKLDYQKQIDDALNSAKADVAAAETTDAVKQAATDGRTAMLQIKDAADLQSAKIAAERALLAKHDAIIEAINQKNNIDSDGKAALIAQVESAYNTALGKVDNPTPATINQVNTERDNGIDNMQNVLISAGDLDSSIKEYQDKLDQVAQDAVERVNNSSMTDDAKQEAITEINKARDDGKKEIAAQDNLADIKTAEAAGEAAILKAEKDTSLAAAKDVANKQIDDAVTSAKEELSDPDRGLNAAEIAAAEAAIDTAAIDAHNKINAATTESAVTAAEKLGQSTIYQEVDKAALVAKKRQAKEEIQAAIDKEQFSEEDKQKAQKIMDTATTSIDKATNNTDIKVAKDLALAGIKNIKDAADLNTAKDAAIAALDKELNGDAATGDPGILAQIANNHDLTPEEVTKYQDQAKEAYDKAVAEINGSEDGASIPAKERTGILNIDQALVDAILQNKKNKADTELEQFAKDAATAIDQLELDQTKKDSLKSLVNSELEKAKDKINAATDETGINTALVDGKTAISNISGHATDEELTQAITNAIADLQDKADDVKKQIAQSYNDGKIDQDQYKQLNDQVQTALDNATTAINQATTPAEVSSVAATGVTSIAAVGTAKGIEEALNDNLTALNNAADQANQAIDASSSSPAEKKEQKAAIEVERVKAADKIKAAKNTSDPITNMAAAKDDGVKTIANISKLYGDKDAAIKYLKKMADAIKAQIAELAKNPSDAANPYLSAGEVAAANKAVNDALDAAISAINAAADNNEIDSAKTAGDAAITNSTLPAQLIVEKNKQIAAINAYATGANGNGAIDGLGLTDEHKTALKAQIETARKKAVDKINNVQLPANPTTADLTDATAAITDAEQGNVTSGDVADFGEAGINTIVNAAKDQGTLNHKNDNIKALEQYAADAKQKIEQLGLPADKQQDQKAAVDAEVTKAKAEILAAADATAADRELSTGKTNIDNVLKSAQLDGKKCAALDAVKDEQTKAITIVNKSSLTPEQKKAAIAEINGVYAGIKQNIEATSNDSDLDTAKTDGINKVQDILNKENSENHQYFNNEIENTKDLATDYSKLELTTDEKSKYSDLIAKVEQGIGDLNKSTDLEAAVNAYDSGRTALNKLIADKDVNDAAQAVKDKIDQIPDDVLSAADKEALKGKVNTAADKATSAINNVDAPAGDVAGKADKINQIKTDGMKDIAAYDTQALDHTKTDAKNKLEQEADDANTAIDNSTLSDEQKTEQKQKIQDALTNAQGKVDDATDQAGVNTALTDGKTAIDDVSKTTTILLEQNQAIKDLQDAADKANTAIDASNLSDEDKAAKKADVAAAVEDAQYSIGQATTSDDIQTALTTGKTAIEQVVTDANLQAAKNDAKQDLQTAADNANTAIDNSTLTDEQKTEQKQKIQDALTDAQGKVDAATDQAGVDTALSDGKTAIEQVVTDVNLQAAKNNAKQDLQTAVDNANTAIDSSNLTDEQKTEQKQKIRDALTDAQGKVDAATDQAGVDTALSDGKTAIDTVTTGTTLLDTQHKAEEQLQSAADKAITAIDNSNLTEAEKTEQKQKVQDDLTAAKDKINQATDPAGVASELSKGKDLLTARQDAITKIDHAYTTAKERLAAGEISPTQLADAKQKALENLDNAATGADINNDLSNWLRDIAKSAVQDAASAADQAIDSNTSYSQSDKTKLKDKIAELLNEAIKDQGAIDHATDHDGMITERNNAIEAIIKHYTDTATINQVLHSNDSSSNNGSTVTPTPLPVSKKQTLLHNSYVYDEAGQRANKLVLKAGSTVKTYGTKEIAGQTYVIVHSQGQEYYLVAENIIGKSAKLSHNAYVYNHAGKRVGKTVLKKDKSIAVYGSPVKIAGKQYYIIGAGRYVKAANVKTMINTNTASQPTTLGPNEKPLMHNAYLYNEQGERVSEVVLTSNSIVEMAGSLTVNGREFTKLTNGYYVAAANVTGIEQKLTHNAAVYNKSGKQIGKKVMKKGKQVTVYGDPITIKGKKYYIIGRNQYLKVSNF
ncbi:DUF1542 domain-containing protein [Lactobacillus sp. ESL0677]|uniref:DUF1542 domain-containing protein n=1 Tax=Lactobacillus sp. ESL0677 TaxID=2983208 RepID=UPI0023F8FD17|nr:DUF1542 domain-containing protein [Lactobacillus sp. ESL0677]WEV37456.1 DUF1542 domain-containing protein [Lactobacillus sp. ESL0677]